MSDFAYDDGRVDFVAFRHNIERVEREARRTRRQRRNKTASPIIANQHETPQPSLFDDIDFAAPIRQHQLPNDNSIEARFIAFHRANPHVLETMRRLALEAKRRGFQRWSIWGVLQVIRWEQHTQTATAEPWKINNSFTPIYARLLMRIEPALAGFFETRQTDIDIDHIIATLGL